MDHRIIGAKHQAVSFLTGLLLFANSENVQKMGKNIGHD